MLTGIFILMLIGLLVQTAFFAFLVLFLAPKWIPMKERKERRKAREFALKRAAMIREVEDYVG